MSKLLRRLRYWLHRDRMDAELAEEMEYHRSMIVGDGRLHAEMGNSTLSREDAREVWIWPWLESFSQDAAYALRTMRREPGFTVVALLALGSAIGLNTSLFTIFNAIALRPWAVRDVAQVVNVNRFSPQGGGDFSIAEYRYLAQQSHSFNGMIAMQNGERVKLDERPMQLTYVSGNYFRVLGIGMERGRGFLDEEDVPDAPVPVAVISHQPWQNYFGADPQMVGRTIRMDDQPFTVVGVASEDFTGTNSLRNDIWAPLAAKKRLRPSDPSVQAWLTAPDFCCTPMAGRLNAGVTRVHAQAELEVLINQFRDYHHIRKEHTQIVLAGTSWIETPRKKKQVVPLILTMFLAVTLVLMLACANVGNLLLARAAARCQEMAVRLSLGSSRARLIRQLLVESMLLAVAAAAIGLAVALVVPSTLLHRLAQDQAWRAVLDWKVLAYTIGVAVVSCLAFGLAPALHGTKDAISAALKAGGSVDGVSGQRLKLRSVLLSVQVATSVILLATAGVLVRGMQRTQNLDSGYDVANVNVLTIDLPASQYTGPRTRALTRDLMAQLELVQGLPPVGLALNAPLSNSKYSTSFRPTDEPNSRMLQIYVNDISPGYAAAVGMRLVAGRNFSAEDSGRDVLMINEAAARRWWPGESPVGKTVLTNNKMCQIVGILSDTYANDLSAIEAVIYLPITGQRGTPTIVVRDRSTGTVNRIATIVKQLEPRAEVRAESLAASFARQLQPSIYGSEIAGFLGLLALAIASVGMYGVFAYVVGQRTREIGVRMALGARPAQIAWLVLGSSARALGAGLIFGVAGAAAVATLLAHAMPGIQTQDPLAYVAVILLLTAAVALASAFPARRATRIDPVRALRWE